MRSAVSSPSPVVAKWLKITWPDCSPPSAAPARTISSSTYLSPTGVRSSRMPSRSSARSSWLATASRDGTARIWDIATGRERAVLKNHTDCVTAVAVAPDGTWLATASRDGTARIWDAAGGHPRALMQVDGPLSACAWPSTDALAVGGSAGLYLFRFVPG